MAYYPVDPTNPLNPIIPSPTPVTKPAPEPVSPTTPGGIQPPSPYPMPPYPPTPTKPIYPVGKSFSIQSPGIFGVIDEAEVDDFLIPEGGVVKSKNVHFDRRGAITLRLGMTAIGSTVSAGYPCLGMHNVSGSTLLVAFSDGTNNDIYRWSGSDCSKCLEDDTKDSRTRFVDFAGRTIRVNGIDNSIRCWTGVADGPTYWEYTGNPINPQQLWGIEPKFIEVYKSRVYVIGDNTNDDRLYFSSVINSAGNITWDTTLDYVDINPDDGENVTGLRRYSLELLIFKPNYIYRFKTAGMDPDPLIKIGTRSNESIIEGKKGLYFHHDNGFFRYTGEIPEEISLPIRPFVAAIPLSARSTISAWHDDNHIVWSVGDLTVDGEPWKNVELRFTESDDTWTVYSRATPIKWATDFANGSTLVRAISNSKGEVFTYDSGYTDSGEPIPFFCVLKWYELGSVIIKKTVPGLVAICKKAQGTDLMYQIDNEESWHTLGQLRKYLTYFLNKNISCHRIQFKIAGVSSVETFVFQKIVILPTITEGLIE